MIACICVYLILIFSFEPRVTKFVILFFFKLKSGERPGDEDIITRGHLYRKHIWESLSKPASHRAWDKLYFVVKPNQLIAYKDQKHAKTDKQTEPPIELSEAIVEAASDYKRKHCLRLKLQNGAEYLFKAKDDQEMDAWIQHIATAISANQELSTQGSSSRAQTLPASRSEPEKKKASFFTLKMNR